MADRKDDPSTPSLNYQRMMPRWQKMTALLGGTETMRAAGKAYLPQYPGESNGAYQARLQMAVLYNVTRLTLGSWVGRPFSDPVTTEDDVPEEIEQHLDDVDLQGNNLTVFSRAWFSDAVAKGFSHCMVDFSNTDASPDRTLSDDREQGTRPFLTHIRPENLIFAKGEVVDGVDQLTQVRLKEVTTEMEGFEEIEVQWIRQLTLDTQNKNIVVELWRFNEKKQEWETAPAPPPMSIDQIPIVTFYAADREALMLNIPPMDDLAELNIRHWQSTADQNNILSVTRFPILAGAGMIGDGKVEIGPHQILINPSKDARFYYVEHSGKAISAGREDLLQLEAQMANYGAEFLKKKPNRQTATARALDSAEATSPLQDISTRFLSSLQQMLALWAKWIKQEDGGTAKVAVDFGPEVAESEDLKTLVASRAARDISRKTYLMELKRRGVLSDDFDEEADKQVLEDEAQSLMADNTGDGDVRTEPTAGQKVPSEGDVVPSEDE